MNSSNPPSPAQREKELQRLAFARGVKYREAHHTYELSAQEIDVAACKEYPDPAQPREIEFGGETYRFADGAFALKTSLVDDSVMWYRSPRIQATPAAIKALHDLLERPNV